MMFCFLGCLFVYVTEQTHVCTKHKMVCLILLYEKFALAKKTLARAAFGQSTLPRKPSQVA
jgi:hypothetical protein